MIECDRLRAVKQMELAGVHFVPSLGEVFHFCEFCDALALVVIYDFAQLLSYLLRNSLSCFFEFKVSDASLSELRRIFHGQLEQCFWRDTRWHFGGDFARTKINLNHCYGVSLLFEFLVGTLRRRVVFIGFTVVILELVSDFAGFTLVVHRDFNAFVSF